MDSAGPYPVRREEIPSMDARGKLGKLETVSRQEIVKQFGRRASWVTFGFGMCCILGAALALFALTACRAFR